MPLHWSADRCQFQDFEFTIRQLQAGTGLIVSAVPNPPCTASSAHLSADLDALAAYCTTQKVAPGDVWTLRRWHEAKPSSCGVMWDAQAAISHRVLRIPH